MRHWTLPLIVLAVLIAVGCGSDDGAPSTSIGFGGGPADAAAGDDVGADAGADMGAVRRGSELSLRQIAAGLVAPVRLMSAPDDSGRLFIVDRIGEVRVVDARGQLVRERFLELSDQLVALGVEDPRGLLGFAFHPSFADNGRVFAFYTAPMDRASSFDHLNVVAEFRVGDDGTIDPATERRLLAVDNPGVGHSGGAMAFGPDGHLFVAFGDGGGEGDQGFGHPPLGHAQDITTLLGSVVRLDVDSTVGSDKPYDVPADNPFVGETGRDEIFAHGFRDPSHLSFDAETGQLFVTDRGEALMEEVNVVTRGGNYGWNVREGTLCYNRDDSLTPLETCAETGVFGQPLVDPVVTYTRPPQSAPDGEVQQLLESSDLHGLAVIGGGVYRGQAMPAWQGAYLFGDRSSAADDPDGQLLAAVPGEGGWQVDPISIAGDRDGRLERFVTGFGQDADGELYLLTSREAGLQGETGVVYRLAP